MNDYTLRTYDELREVLRKLAPDPNAKMLSYHDVDSAMRRIEREKLEKTP